MENNETLTKLTILESSDVHGNLFPIHYGTNEPLPLGLARMSTYIKKCKEAEANLLVIDNGDVIQGTPLTYHYVRFLSEKPNPVITLLNHIGYDLAVIGNHEFNYGMDILRAAVNQSGFPWLSANIIEDSTKEPVFGKPYFIKTYENGLKAVVLGLTTHYIPNWENPSHIKDLAFEDALESAKKWVPFIRQTEKPDILIVSYHGGFERDLETGEPTETQSGENQAYRICHEIEGIDLLLTGHQHRQIAGELNGVTVLQPSFNGQHLGEVTITLEKQDGSWHVLDKSVKLISMEEQEVDQDALNLIQEFEEQTQKWLDQPIGSIDGSMEISDPFQVRLNEHPLIEFINRVQMDAAGVEISNTSLFHNGAPGFSETVTMRDIVSNYVYPNTLMALKISGQDIKDALERSASYFIVKEDGTVDVNPDFYYPKPQHYNYDMWEGIDYELTISRPIGERVTKLMYKGEPLKLDDEYEVVMNNYRAGGGGEYGMFKGKPVVKEIQTDMAELLANYFLKHKKVKATVNINWRVIY